MLKKIITYFLILAVVLPVFASVVPLGGGLKIAYAQNSSEASISDPCDLGIGRALLRNTARYTVPGFAIYEYFKDKETKTPSSSVWDCAAYAISYFLYEVVMQGAIMVAGWASTLFNVSIQFSLTGDVFDAGKNLMIRDGWTMIRDLFNLVFIFVLLYAAIATILQYGNVDIKKLLPGLIVAALLVNFSLMISKVVIDASHIFAWEFYNRIDSTNDGQFPELKNDLNVNGNFQKKNLANVFLAGFNPQSLLTGQTRTIKSVDDKGAEIKTEKDVPPTWLGVINAANKNGEKLIDTVGRMILIILLETALALFSAFILFIGATMFIARVAILWIVMIFSPIGFLGMVLPSMEKYSKMWWEYLMNQSFFAPAFLFMFFLSTKFVNSNMMKGLLKVEPNGDMKIATGLDGGEIASILLHFGITAILMFGSLYVARLLGGESAELAQKGRAFALGGVKHGINNRATRWVGGAAFGDREWFAKTIGRIPGGNILGRKLGAMKKADEDKARKVAEKYAGTLSGAGRTSLDKDKERSFVGRALYGGGLSKPTREGYEKIIEKKKAEEEERGRIADKMIELMGSKFDEFAGGLKKGDAKEKIKAILFRGNTEDLDKWINLEDKEVEGKNEKEIDEKNEIKRGFDNKIKEINDKLTIARNKSENTDDLMKKLLETEKESYENNKKLIEIVGKEKHRENLQKTIDKYEGKQVYKSGKPEDKKEEKKKD